MVSWMLALNFAMTGSSRLLSSIIGEWAMLESIRNGKLGLGEKTAFAAVLKAADDIPRSQDIAVAKPKKVRLKVVA